MKNYESGEYEKAIDIFKTHLEETNDSTGAKKSKQAEGKVNYYIAESYRLSNRLKEALPYYESAFEDKYYTDNSEFYYAMSLKVNGRYEDAIKQFKSYAAESANYTYRSMAEEQIIHAEEIRKLAQVNKFIILENCSELNTKHADFSPVVWKDELYFTSSRNSQFIFGGTGGGFLDIYKMDIDDIERCEGRIEKLPPSINLPKRHEASAAISPNGKTIVFARSADLKDDESKEVDLYISNKTGLGEWTEPELLPISNPKYWDSTPIFSPDGKRLYFASNRPGGFGGVDIWRANRRGKNAWGKVINIGSKINTEGNELFPFVAKNGNLYFSSDGHVGLGGLDVFVAKRIKRKITVENMGAPVNSYSDDFGFSLFEYNKGFLASNRRTENAKGNDDIYYYTDKTPSLRDLDYFLAGKSYYDNTKEKFPLPNVSIYLLDESGFLVDSTLSNDTSYYRFANPIKPNTSYTVIARKEEYIEHNEVYFSSTENINIQDLPLDVDHVDLEKDVSLYKDIFRLEEPGVEEISLQILYDLDKSNIRPDAAKILDQLVEYLQQNEIKVELGSHTDERGGNNYNQRLSERRAKAAVSYLAVNGVREDRLIAKGYGEGDLLIKNAKTEEEHQANRRTTIRVIRDDR